MQFDKKDRLVLINQYQILKQLDSSQADHYDQLIEVLQNGYAVFYPMLDEPLAQELSAYEGRLVLDILAFYRVVEDHKTRHPDGEVAQHWLARFQGFNADAEPGHLRLTRFLIETRGEFPEQQPYADETDRFTSPWHMAKPYRKIVDAWCKQGRPEDLDEAGILEILNVVPPPRKK